MDINHKLGLCCLLAGVKGGNFKTVRLGWAETNNAEAVKRRLIEVWTYNIAKTVEIIQFCAKNGISLYRLSSSLFPLADHPKFELIWEYFLMDGKNWLKLQEVVKSFVLNSGRFSMHPSQFVSIGSVDKQIRDNSIRNLEHHAQFFDAIGMNDSHWCPINIHINNGLLGEEVVENVEQSVSRLSNSVRQRLVFENEDKGFWNIANIREYFPYIPITFDSLHNLINPSQSFFTEEEAMEVCSCSWKMPAIFHHSEGRDHSKDRKHSDWITRIPNFGGVFWEIEAKKKELAIFKFLQHNKVISIY